MFFSVFISFFIFKLEKSVVLLLLTLVSEPKVGDQQVHGAIGVSSISLTSMETTAVGDMEKSNGANFALWKS